MKSDNPITLEIGELAEWFDQRAISMLRRFTHDSKVLLEEIDRAISSVRAAAAGFVSKASSDFADRGQIGYAEPLAQKIMSFFEKVQSPQVLTFDDVNDVYKKLFRALEDSTRAAQTTVPHLKPRFKSSIIEMDSEFKKLRRLLFRLADVIRESQPVAQQIEGVRRSIKRAVENQELIRQRGAETRSCDERISQLNTQLVGIEFKREKVREEGWFIELEKVRSEIQAIETKFLHFQAQLNKPLRKLEKLVGEDKVQLRAESLVALRSLVGNSSRPILSEIDLRSVSSLLDEVQRLIHDGKIVLEKRKERRALHAIRLAENELKRLHEEYEGLKRRERQLISTSEVSGPVQDCLRLEASRTDVEAQIIELKQSKARLLAETAELESDTNELLRGIEDLIHNLLGVKVSALATR